MTTFGAVRSEQPSRLLAPALMALLAAGLLLQLYRIDAQSLWLDELWTAASTDPAIPFRQWLEEWVLPDVHPPLHLLLLRGWRRIFGGDPLALRLFSLAASFALVAGVLLLQRWTPVVRQPLALAAWFACCSGVVLYAQEARAYALLLLTATLATLLAAAIALRMERCEPIGRPVAVLVAVVVAAEYSHYFGALVAIGLFGALFFFAACWHRRHLRIVTLGGFSAVGLLLPWLVLHVPRMADKLGGNFWVTNRWSKSFPDAAELMLGSPIFFLLLVAAVAAMLFRRPRLLRHPGCWVPLWAMALMLLGAIAVSLHTPVITARNLLILLPPFLLLTVTALGEGFEAAPGASGGRSGPILLLIVAASLVLAVQQLSGTGKDQWREAAARVAALPGCEEARLQVYYWPEGVYGYYLPPSLRDRLHSVSLFPTDPEELPRIEPPDEACPLILWTGHIVGDWLLEGVLAQLGIDSGEIVVWRTRGNMVILDDRRLAAGE